MKRLSNKSWTKYEIFGKPGEVIWQYLNYKNKLIFGS